MGNKDKVQKHRFYPFIHYTITERRYRRSNNPEASSQHDKKIPRTVACKKREIFYANHLDSQIYSYYAYIINSELEKKYSSDPLLCQSVIAYRSIPVNENGRSKSSIDFAKEVFDYISKSKGNKTVICLDIKSFFDTLDHKVLKKAWCDILDSNSLPSDHYQIFKAVTKFTYVEIGDIIDEFSELKIKKLKYLKNKNVTSFCNSGREFRERIVNNSLIKVNQDKSGGQKKGIPQGSSISACLSNLYMLSFDKYFCKLVDDLKGLYRRYSDDILVICKPSDADHLLDTLKRYIENKLKLDIQDQKTQKISFEWNSTDSKWTCATVENGKTTNDKPLSYLGFDFDGTTTRIRQKSLSLYYRRLKRLIRRKARYANYALKHNQRAGSKVKDPWIYRFKIYKLKSHLGSKRKSISGKVFWGNYISYANTASSIMHEPAIKKQIRNHWRIISKKIIDWEKEYELERTPSRRHQKRLARTTPMPLNKTSLNEE